MQDVECQNNKLTSIGDLDTCTNLVYISRDHSVNLIGCSAPVINTSSLPNAVAEISYNAEVEASGTGSIHYSIKTSAVSNGFECDGNTGRITGIPRFDKDIFTLTVKATNFVGETSKDFVISIAKAASLPNIITKNSSPICAITKQSSLLLGNASFNGFETTGDAGIRENLPELPITLKQGRIVIME